MCLEAFVDWPLYNTVARPSHRISIVPSLKEDAFAIVTMRKSFLLGPGSYSSGSLRRPSQRLPRW